jgi:hypothetical protein
MQRKTVNSAVALLAVLLATSEVLAYKETTHADITKAASERSDIADPSTRILESLGLGSSLRHPGLVATGPIGVPSPTSVQELLMRGAREEDHGKKSLNHFFDPQREGVGLPTYDPSPVWALDTNESAQEFSLDDARRYLWGALTGVSERNRHDNLVSVFLALGHVVHHIQDMHQPQHVRSDTHCDDSPILLWFLPLPRGCATSGIRGLLYRPSAYETYVWKWGVVPLAGYPTPDYATFQLARHFWEMDTMGGAEFTSDNFVSIGTNFELDVARSPIVIRSDADHPLPRGNDARLVSSDINDPALIRRVTEPMPLAGDISFVQTPVVDAYRDEFTGFNPYTSTLSIWYDSVVLGTGEVQATPSTVFTLNSVTYQAAMERLLPRAAAYSTGLINYFFRGRIEIGLPADGVYGVVDHATTYAAGQGFDKLKLRLRNASPDGVKPSGERVPQTMQGGTLVAVAKYTLNSCYLPDLTGDFAVTIDTGEVIYPAGCSLDQYFTGEEQIAQSAAILAATLEKAPAEFTFDFSSQPIPINARDLRIQVVYTGQLGAEADGIAFGGRDISEPTHVIVYNNSDYYAVDGRFYTPAQIRSDPALSQGVAGRNIDPAPLEAVSLTVVPERPITGVAQAVPVNGYVRVAVLADVDAPFPLQVLARFAGAGDTLTTFPGVWAATTSLRDEPAYITPFGIYRGTRAHFVDVVFKANSTAPLADDELVTMSTRTVADPGPTPIPLRF